MTNAPSSVKDIDISFNNSANIFVRTHEKMAMQIDASASIGDRIVADYIAYPLPSSISKGMTNWDAQNSSDTYPVNTNGMLAKEIYLASVTNQIRLSAGYYRGRIYDQDNSTLLKKNLGEGVTNWASIFSSGDRKNLVVARDDGIIYFSEDSGITFRTISAPGKYEFKLSSTPKGSAMVAVVTIGNLENNSKLVPINLKEWYSVGVSAKGDKLVVSSESSPVLSIKNINGVAVVSWSASFTNFILQQNRDLTAANWADVTNSASIVNGQNEVTFQFKVGSDFFRLRSK